MAKRGARKRRWFKNRGPGGQLGWDRPGPIALNTLNLATQQTVQEIRDGERVQASRLEGLDFSRAFNPKLLRVIFRITVECINVIAPALLQYWWGVRIAEQGAGGAIAANLDVFTATAAGKQMDWIFRGQGAVTATVAGPNPISEIGKFNGAGGIFWDYKVNRYLGPNQTFVFHHGIRNSAGTPVDCTVQGTLNAELLWRLPR